MPRKAREKSESGIYHVMLRGINQQQIFEDEEDYLKFIQILETYQAISEYKIYAYCLMGNHIHLLIKVEKEPLEQVFKRIGSKYVYWYNTKYQRKGHLFQDRFKSEPVDNDSYFLTVIKYIHQNPIKAGLCKKAEDYKYNSCHEYLDKPVIVDTELLFSMIPKHEFLMFTNTLTKANCLDIEEQITRRVTDEEARKIIKKYSKCENATEFQALDLKSRDKYLRKFKEKGISIRQISRLTGVSYYIVQKI
ncbi:MAG: transposase [Clostridia bacterium]|nr:transposase [Clostridia bacterium]